MGMEKILHSRTNDSYDPECLNICTQLLVVNPDIYTLWNYRKEVVLMEIEKGYNLIKDQLFLNEYVFYS